VNSDAHAQDTYTHGHHESVLRSHEWRTAENSAGYLLPHLHQGMEILDVGCGPGTITLDLARLVSPGRVLGVDTAGGVVETARRHAAEQGDGTTRFETGDVYRLDLPDDSFDVVHAHQMLQHLTDPVAALREMRRVCRPGGLVAVRDSDYAAMTWFPANSALIDWLDLYHRVARGNDAEPDAGRELRSWAPASGFRRRALLRERVDLRHARRTCLVGVTVGRSLPALGIRRAGARAKPGDDVSAH
jgi:SAM-dependent methyltransferase